MTGEEKAVEIFKEEFNCAQAVLAAFSGNYGLEEKEAKKLACGFGAGCGRQSLTCGAISGAYMAIGLKHGRTEKEDLTSREVTYKMINEFSEKFKSLHGSVNCSDLLGCNLGSDEGQKDFQEKELVKKKCLYYVRDACRILESMGF